MKKLLTITAAALMAISASAQSEAGSFTLKPNVGVTYTTATGDNGKGADPAVGLTAGVEGMYMVNNKFGVALGLNYTGYNYSRNVLNDMRSNLDYLGLGHMKSTFPEGKDVICSNYYFNIPVTANYYVAPGLALKAGIAMNILSTAKIDGDDEFKLDWGPFAQTESVKAKDSYKSTFFSIPVGASYEINNFVFDLRYNFGLGNVRKKGDGSFNALSFTVGYKF